MHRQRNTMSTLRFSGRQSGPALAVKQLFHGITPNSDPDTDDAARSPSHHSERRLRANRLSEKSRHRWVRWHSFMPPVRRFAKCEVALAPLTKFLRPAPSVARKVPPCLLMPGTTFFALQLLGRHQSLHRRQLGT